MKKFIIICWFLISGLIVCSCSHQGEVYSYSNEDISYNIVDNDIYWDYKGIERITKNIFEKIGIIKTSEDAGNIAYVVMDSVLENASPSDALYVKCVEYDEKWYVQDKTNNLIVTMRKSDGKMIVLHQGEVCTNIINNHDDACKIAYYILKAVYKEKVNSTHLNLYEVSDKEWVFELKEGDLNMEGGQMFVSLSVPNGDILGIWGGM